MKPRTSGKLNEKIYIGTRFLSNSCRNEENGELEAMEIEKGKFRLPCGSCITVLLDEWSKIENDLFGPSQNGVLVKSDELMSSNTNSGNSFLDKRFQPRGEEAATYSSNVETSERNDMDIDEPPKEFREDTTQSQLMEYQFNDPPNGGPLDIFANDSPEEIAKRSRLFKITSDMTEEKKASNLALALSCGCTKVPTDDNHHFLCKFIPKQAYKSKNVYR